jgi:hypothetical protein
MLKCRQVWKAEVSTGGMAPITFTLEKQGPKGLQAGQGNGTGGKQVIHALCDLVAFLSPHSTFATGLLKLIDCIKLPRAILSVAYCVLYIFYWRSYTLETGSVTKRFTLAMSPINGKIPSKWQDMMPAKVGGTACFVLLARGVRAWKFRVRAVFCG